MALRVKSEAFPAFRIINNHERREVMEGFFLGVAIAAAGELLACLIIYVVKRVSDWLKSDGDSR